MAGLPTAGEMLAAAEDELRNADRALSDAADWLRSDWTPVGSALSAEQARRRTVMRQAIREATAAIGQVLRE